VKASMNCVELPCPGRVWRPFLGDLAKALPVRIRLFAHTEHVRSSFWLLSATPRPWYHRQFRNWVFSYSFVMWHSSFGAVRHPRDIIAEKHREIEAARRARPLIRSAGAARGRSSVRDFAAALASGKGMHVMPKSEASPRWG